MKPVAFSSGKADEPSRAGWGCWYPCLVPVGPQVLGDERAAGLSVVPRIKSIVQLTIGVADSWAVPAPKQLGGHVIHHSTQCVS